MYMLYSIHPAHTFMYVVFPIYLMFFLSKARRLSQSLSLSLSHMHFSLLSPYYLLVFFQVKQVGAVMSYLECSGKMTAYSLKCLTVHTLIRKVKSIVLNRAALRIQLGPFFPIKEFAQTDFEVVSN